MSNKEPKTTEFPDFDDLLATYLDQRSRLEQVIAGLRALDRDPTALNRDLGELTRRIEAVEEMRLAIARHQHHAASRSNPQAA